MIEKKSGMIPEVRTDHVLFLDIETVSGKQNFNELNERLKEQWQKKSEGLSKYADEEKASEEWYLEKAALYPEFGKIVCISVGFIVSTTDGAQIRIKSFYGSEEKDVLLEFFALVNQYFKDENNWLCAHNGREFDFPYIARRAVINRLPLPVKLNPFIGKPWENRLLDTMQIWKFGSFKNFVSLDLLTALFDVPSPKEDIDGSQVGPMYWQENKLPEIVTYCQKDVAALMQVFLCIWGKPTIEEHNIHFASDHVES